VNIKTIAIRDPRIQQASANRTTRSNREIGENSVMTMRSDIQAKLWAMIDKIGQCQTGIDAAFSGAAAI